MSTTITITRRWQQLSRIYSDTVDGGSMAGVYLTGTGHLWVSDGHVIAQLPVSYRGDPALVRIAVGKRLAEDETITVDLATVGDWPSVPLDRCPPLAGWRELYLGTSRGAPARIQITRATNYPDVAAIIAETVERCDRVFGLDLQLASSVGYATGPWTSCGQLYVSSDPCRPILLRPVGADPDVIDSDGELSVVMPMRIG